MTELRLKSSRFRAEREPDWRRLESLLSRVEKGSAAALSVDDLIAAPVLYRAALSALSVARATSLDQGLVEYLESLSARAYFLIYGSRVTALERAQRFFARDWPQAAQTIWRETLICFVLTMIAAAVAFVLTSRDPSWYAAFMPGGLVEGRDPWSSTAELKASLFNDAHGQALSVLATFLFTHNAQVALMAFALGFAFGLPTVLLEIQNGFMLGAFLSIFVSHGLGYEVGGWLFIHGVTELFSIMLAGGAGMRIGWAIAFPGQRTRLAAAAVEGRQAATLMAGVVVMLFCAGLLEGVGRQVIQQTPIRYAIAITSGVVWLSYFYIPRPWSRGPGNRAPTQAAHG